MLRKYIVKLQDKERLSNNDFEETAQNWWSRDVITENKLDDLDLDNE